MSKRRFTTLTLLRLKYFYVMISETKYDVFSRHLSFTIFQHADNTCSKNKND